MSHHDQMLLCAIVRAIEVIGEAASKVTAETQAASSDIPWLSIVGMRNRLVHGYFDIDLDVVRKVPSINGGGGGGVNHPASRSTPSSLPRVNQRETRSEPFPR